MGKLGLVAASLAVATALAAGCSEMTDGNPVAVPTDATDPTEPTIPTTRPSRTPPTSTPSPPPTTSTPGAQTLPANDQGYVFIETKSGKTRCQLSADSVGCEAQFTSPPETDDGPANGVIVTPDGELQWIVGNLGNIPVVTLDSGTYQAVGWTIATDSSGTSFTNSGTGHGMFVSIEKVDSF